MSKILLIIAVVVMALPSFARRSSQRDQNQNRYEVAAEKDLKILEELYDIAVTRASDLSCFAKKPNIFDRIRKNKRYKRHKTKRKNNDLCNIEYVRIETAADNLEAFAEIKDNGRNRRRDSARNANKVMFKKVTLTRNAILDDIQERRQRMSALACSVLNSNVDLCKVEKEVISFIKRGLLPIVNNQMRSFWGYECVGTRECRN